MSREVPQRREHDLQRRLFLRGRSLSIRRVDLDLHGRPHQHVHDAGLGEDLLTPLVRLPRQIPEDIE